MCKTNSWKSIQSQITSSSITIIGTRSDDKFVRINAVFTKADNEFTIPRKVKALIDNLESFRNAELPDTPNSVNNIEKDK